MLVFSACGSSGGNGANGSNQIIIDGQIVSSANGPTTKNADSAPVSGTVTCTINAADSSGNVFFTTTATVQLDFAPGSVTPINGQNFPVGTFNLPDNPSLQSGFALSVECQKDGANFLQALVANYSGNVSLSLLSSEGFHVTVTLSNFFDFATSDETIAFFESFSCFSLKILEPLTATLCTDSTANPAPAPAPDPTPTKTATEVKTETTDTQPTSEPSLTFCETISLGITVAEEVVCGPSSGGTDCVTSASCSSTTPCPTGFDCADGCCKAQAQGLCNNNRTCEPNLGENGTNCPLDCYCGDGVCREGETPDNCAPDCGTAQIADYCAGCDTAGGTCITLDTAKVCVNPTNPTCPALSSSDSTSLLCVSPGACDAAAANGAPASTCTDSCCVPNGADCSACGDPSCCDPTCADGSACGPLRGGGCTCIPTRAAPACSNPGDCGIDGCTASQFCGPVDKGCACQTLPDCTALGACSACLKGESCQFDNSNFICDCQPDISVPPPKIP